MIEPEAAIVAQLLGEQDKRVVLAESCTAGLAAALLAAVPGISTYLCGSWVTYQEACKIDWLGVPRELIQEHTAVSAEVTAAMATAALSRTNAADVGAAITGHLGPLAPADLDGVCFLAIAQRAARQVDSSATHSNTIRIRRTQRITLEAVDRVARQHEAARKLLALLSHQLSSGQVG
ncbi:MAG: nicotinamide-nucleotide amidohydrolase family protein [Planctomycetales bacterium]|nr:nicotinamide-nucleotide amidohydrolase family protein [Planctomycetales bacterium]MCA9169746.1 nicotinamide-nucleotide amidohydrolase family protein [Planctomycetales bacterium]